MFLYARSLVRLGVETLIVNKFFEVVKHKQMSQPKFLCYFILFVALYLDFSNIIF